MRRLNVEQKRERGGISVIVALLMVVLLGFAAIAVDVGMLYSERAQLQNGADAAALLVAQKCATSNADPNCAATSTLAASVLNGNALDGRSNVKSLALDLPNRTVNVTAGAQEEGQEPNKITLFFANALGFSSAEVNANASVQWGSPVKGTAPFPITVSICQVRGHTDEMVLLQLHGKLANGICNYGPSGAPVSGGFGGLVQDSGCGAYIDILVNEGGSETGSNPPQNCDATFYSWAADINAGKDVILLLPVFDGVSGTGSTAIYRMKTFAAFKVAGWKFSGGNTLPYTFHNRYPDVPLAFECREALQCKGIIGTFVKYVSLADGYTLGAVDPDGVTVVEISG
ncbi:Tad domain-containing protein [Pseudarthrobacter sp. RMG13]|uniref:Tad domain-containing protein n=1 Tax=Pseudarthrobacter humi TaxID=2952523 RepID=A0ABT1LJX8_9MICC|nr:TadE/TadG family type IV pilus assembly protein [Pseudarthrobacter humi]MCP8998416.1 Tad domain-containing protein [Pseudarthrobacter humi]